VTRGGRRAFIGAKESRRNTHEDRLRQLQCQYSISDDKVQGKVFKIRCRKCGESIVVKGEAQASAGGAPPPSMPAGPGLPGMEEEGDAETRVFDYSGYQADSPGVDANEWHIVVEGNQQGPYTTQQIKEYITTGSLDIETFVWRDGFSDWIPAREVREFADAVGAAARGTPLPPVAAAAPADLAAPGHLPPADGVFGSSADLFDAGPRPGSGQPGQLVRRPTTAAAHGSVRIGSPVTAVYGWAVQR
jgi:hypothetical protein